MILNIFKLSIAMLLLFAVGKINAQDFQGQAVYQTKTTVDMSNFGGENMTPDRKKMIEERMKSMLEKVYVLNFNRSESIYKEEEKLEAPGQGGGRWGMMGSFTGGPQYKNIKEGQVLQEQEFFGKQFLIKDDLQKLDWKMESESRQIGQYTVFKATAVKEVDEMDFTNMRRRNRDVDETAEKKKDSTKNDDPMADIEVPKTMLVTAWYTPQIPVNQGPGEYWGLPGLILEVNAGRTTMLCTKIVMNPSEKLEIKLPKKGDEVTRKEYNKIMKDKMEEMREMYGGRGGTRNND
ncbi:GLPGLI family protein [Flavobacteriaceae bacterium MAR_2010_188]|nr:GLPGLI family protein [Flavobacteriaceae bacterium MAR_2010_188]